MGLFLLLKRLIPGAAVADLFATPVQIKGHTTKKGVVVAPHTAIRKKHLPESASRPAPAMRDLFAAPPAPAPAPRATKPDRKPETSTEPDLFSVQRPAPTPHVLPFEATPPSNEAPPTSPMARGFGVRPGVSKGERRTLNAAAVALLNSKSDADMTDADRTVLAQYSGNGGCGDSLNEFYTPVPVAKAIWTLLGKAGFAGGDVLEPSAGTGVFLHTAPATAKVQAVELDPISSRISRILHPDHASECASLERFATQDGRLFDAVVGNPPFGPRGALLADDKRDIGKAEHYFLDTALDKTRDGGLVALVLPSSVMDTSAGASFRRDVLCKAEFLGGSRMPNSAFEASHTDVTTDVLLFRKRPQDVSGALGTLSGNQVAALGAGDQEFVAGTYFTDGRGAGNVHGTSGTVMRQFGPIYSVHGSMIGVPAAVEAMPIETPPASPSMQDVLKLLGDDEVAKRRAVSAALKPPYQVARPGDVRVVDGVRYILQGDPARWHRAEEELSPAVRDALQAAQLLDDLTEGRALSPAYARLQLQEALTAWVAAHGQPGRSKPLAAFLAQPSMPNSDGAGPEAHGARVATAARQAARLLGAVNPDGSYSDMVTGQRREVSPLSLETLATTLSLEAGGFTVGQLAARAGKDEAEVLDYLHASPAYAVDPDGMTWSTMDTYVGGELWPKLDAVRAALEDDAEPAVMRKWEMQAAALDAAIAPKVLEDVEITIGSGFVTPDDLNAWLATTVSGKDKPVLTFDPAQAIWGGTTGHYGDAELVLRTLNRKGVKKDEKETLDRVNREFGDWLRQSDRREAVEERYNRTYRGFRGKTYSDAPIAIPGMVTDGLKGFQYPGVRWALEAGSGIIAADVGLGKTVRGLMLSRLMQTTGRSEKPVIVVPKSVLANWLAEAEKWFPGSKVLTIGETYSRNKDGELVGKADNEATRRAKYHQLQQNTYDFVLISQPAWNDLDINPVKKGELADNDFWAKRGDALGNAGDKRLNDLRTRHDQALAQRDFADREHTIYFDELGIDGLIMDEGHAYKNLYAARNRFGENPKFLGGSGLSNRAQDTFFKSAVVREATGGKNVFMLTATPTKNSPLEVYSMLSHIAPEAFVRLGIKNSEDFLDRFCEFTTDEILTVDGKIEDALVTSGFKNLDELREVMLRYIDRKTAEDVGLVIPRGDQVEHYIDMTPAQEAAYQDLRAEVEASKKKDADGDSHIFSVMSRMGKASIDLSLLNGGGGDNAPKLDACVAAAVKHSAEGGQVIFCDHIELHEKIAAKLVAAGVPRSAIGIINASAASSSAARQRICDAFNSGKITHVIGNTPCMGEGVNLQKGTTDIHHLDLPWEPASVQQRNGRGVRQGNTKEAVRLHTYLAKRSFDGYRLQTIKAKRDWQDLLWNGGDRVENLARESASMYDPVIMFAADPEAAMAKRAGDKERALQAKRAEQRGKAIDSFASYNKAQRAIAELEGRGAKRETSDALKRLYGKVSTMRDRLAADDQFDHKHLLDTRAAVAIEPNTGFAWQAGQGMTLAGGSEGPVHYAADATRWVVTHVNPETGKVRARPYGRIATTSIDMDLDRMKAGVTPFDATPAEESAAMAEDAKSGAGVKGSMKLHELRKLPPEMLRDHAPAVNRRMMEAISDYSDTERHGMNRAHYGAIGPDGVPTIVPSYSARNMSPDTHRLIMPTPEDRATAIAAYVKEGMGRTIGTEYTQGHRGRQGESRSVARYPSGGHSGTSNPWGGVLRDVFGGTARDEAKAAVQAATVDAIGAAPTFRDAVTAAIPGMVFPSRGTLGEGAHDAWPKPIAAALRARAEALGVIHQPVHTAVGPNPSYGAGRIDEGVFKHKNERFHGSGYGYGSRTVGEWMNAIGSKGTETAE